MRKRILVFVCVIMVVISCALPVFASSANGLSDSAWYSSFPIDAVEASTGEVYPWPANIGCDDDYAENTFNFYDYGFHGDVVNIPYENDPLMRPGSSIVEFTIYDGNATAGKNSYLRFWADSMIFDYFSHFRIQCGEERLTMYQVIFSFDIVESYLLGTDTEYSTYITHVNELVSLLGTEMSWNVNIADLLWNVLESRGYSRDDSDLLLCNVSIEVCFQYQNASNPVFVVTSDARPSNLRWLNQFKYWFREQNITIPTNPAGFKFDPLGWLVEVMEGFLRFEIFPGFSLDTLLNLVIILTVVLLLIKIFS